MATSPDFSASIGGLETLVRLLARVNDGIIALDSGGRCAFVNETGAGLFGCVPGDLVGKHLWTEVPGSVGQALDAACERAMAGQGACSFGDYSEAQDRWFEHRVYPSADGVSIFSHDITARKTTERAERRLAELNEAVVACAQEGIAAFDRDLRFLLVNPAMAALMGIAPDAVLGRRPGELSAAPVVAGIEARLRRALDGERVTMPDEPGVQLRHGRPVWVSRVMCPMRDRVGEIVGVLGFLRDVTERVEAEAALRTAKQRLRLALEAAGAGVWDWDLRTGHLTWSREHERLWGMAPGSFRGTYAEFSGPVHPEDREAIRRALDRAIETGTQFTSEYRLRAPDGTERWMKGSGHTVATEDGSSTRMLGTVVDVTERKRAELLLECQRSVLERISAGASLPACLEALAIGAEALAPGMACSILVLDDEGTHLRHGAAPSLPRAYIDAIDGEAIGPAAGTCGTAAYTGLPVHTRDIAVDSCWEGYRALALLHGLRACWSTPLFDTQHRVRGTFALYYGRPGLPEPWHVRIIAMATHVAEIALEHERQRAELVAAERRYHDLYEFAPDMYLSIDPRTRAVCECNETLTRVTGYDRSEILGHDVLGLYDPALTDRVRQAAAEFLRVGELRDVELRIRCKDGRLLDVSLNATAVRGPDGTILRSRSSWRDISRQRQAEDDRRALSERLLRSQEDERRRIAREMHDSTGQNLAAIAMNLALLERRVETCKSPDSTGSWTPTELHGLITECILLTDRSAQELRTLSYLLHPPLLEDFGLEPAISEFVAGFARRSGVRVTVEVPVPVPRSTDDVGLTLFRVVQESLANVHRHSGSATASVRLTGDSNRLVLEVRDAGGTAAEGDTAAGVGISGMRERLRLLGGSLEVERGKDGTCVRASVSTREARR